MAKVVVFKGRAHHLPNDSMKADPVPGVWYVGERPQHIPESIPCFTELIFDKALAEQCGRTCGPDCDGDCFAEMYAGIGPSSNDPRNRKRDADLFDCLPWPNTPEGEPAPEPESDPETQPVVLTAPADTSPPAPTDNPPETSGTAAKEYPDA